MDDVLKIFGIFTAMGMAGAGVYAVIALVGVVTRRLEGRRTEGDESLRHELEDLQARVAGGEELQQRVAELEERLDFAERMLAQRPDVARIPASPEGR